MLYTARANYTAQDALDMGLVNYVYPLENLLDEAVSWLRRSLLRLRSLFLWLRKL